MSEYSLISFQQAIVQGKAKAKIVQLERKAENQFLYLFKANVFNYSDFFISTPPGEVRGLITQINNFLDNCEKTGDNSHLLLLNIDSTADKFFAYIADKYKKNKKMRLKYERVLSSFAARNDVKNFIAVKVLLLKHEKYLAGTNLFASQRSFQAADLFIRNVQHRKSAHEAIMSAMKKLIKQYGLIINMSAVELSVLLDPYIKKLVGARVRKQHRQTQQQFEQLSMISDFLPEEDFLH
ncbi:MAG: hypothetical protein RJR37_00470 [Peptococcaceae bacterium MAG4]|nr:hypothetical protein [Peptococcaceae bacterium MAG4]